eukprot:TRINITY_DN61732_c0_g1_i1.p1 TRINITY_DN61732_c0_g1~~TRINITY_DN61732_c0_g1_i1.p1  ORF type:complete len:811 (-),score=148.94 TRINITY_DN61732_c0_g1_i1:50-2482(-)
MPSTLEELEVIAEECSKQPIECLAPVLATLKCQEDLATSFLHSFAGSGEASPSLSRSSRDYQRVTSAFERILDRGGTPWAAEAGDLFRSAAAEAMPALPRRPFARSDFSEHSETLATEEADGDVTLTEDHAVEEAAPADVDAGADAMATDEELTSPCITWLSVLLASLLPLLTDALPRDQNGVCIIPHPHKMDRQEAREDPVMHFAAVSRRPVFNTKKICDNCGMRITDQFYYHCSENCDIDFCQECQTKSQSLIDAFMARVSDGSHETMYRRLFWVIDVTERIGWHVLHLNVADRQRLADELAFEWPTTLFERLVQAAIDVVNARVVHVQDVKDITSDERFWYAIGWLQFLYSTNALPCKTKRLEEQSSRGPKVPYERFILDGINKCEPLSEFQRWRKHPSAKVPNVLDMRRFELTADFCSFLTHSNVVPVSFRRVCLLLDIWEQMQAQNDGRITPLQLEVPRQPDGLMNAVLDRFGQCTGDELRQPLRVVFKGEEAAGPGVTKEFFQVALRSFLVSAEDCDYKLFRYQEECRSYWFDECADNPEAFRAYGILLGQAVLNNTHVPNIFPRALYELLLEDLDSPCAKKLGLQDLGAVSSDIARSLEKILHYVGEDINEQFGDMGWPRGSKLPEDLPLSQANKGEFVQAYTDFFFHERISSQFTPLSEGFKAILGGSSLLRTMVDAVQLEKIVCGGAEHVDVRAIRSGAEIVGWTEEEELEYLPWFWEVLESFSFTEKVQFVIFVTASDRVPLRGWQSLGLCVQKNGVGNDRLPSAYTCFSQLLLPRFASKEQLRQSLLLAIANSEGFGLR